MKLLARFKQKMSLTPVHRNTALKASPALQAALDIIAEKLDDHAKVVGYEFERLRSTSDTDWAALERSTAAANPTLNRYTNVVPYDQNRVKLSQGDNDYINASLLSSKASSQVLWSYIATQGPLRHTAAQFWQMVLEQRVVVIVMLTRVMEKQAGKCAQYFPLELNEEAVFQGPGHTITVKLTAVQDLDSDICMRHFQVTGTSAAAPLVVAHYYYHRWPDFGIPDATTPLRRLAHLLSSSDPSQAGPPVVHCSAGIGRTGTFVVIDVVLKHLLSLDPYDIAGAKAAISMNKLVTHLRKQRHGMVQTVQQYVFIYQSIYDELQAVLSSSEQSLSVPSQQASRQARYRDA